MSNAVSSSRSPWHSHIRTRSSTARTVTGSNSPGRRSRYSPSPTYSSISRKVVTPCVRSHARCRSTAGRSRPSIRPSSSGQVIASFWPMIRNGSPSSVSKYRPPGARRTHGRTRPASDSPRVAVAPAQRPARGGGASVRLISIGMASVRGEPRPVMPGTSSPRRRSSGSRSPAGAPTDRSCVGSPDRNDSTTRLADRIAPSWFTYFHSPKRPIGWIPRSCRYPLITSRCP